MLICYRLDSFQRKVYIVSLLAIANQLLYGLASQKCLKKIPKQFLITTTKLPLSLLLGLRANVFPNLGQIVAIKN